MEREKSDPREIVREKEQVDLQAAVEGLITEAKNRGVDPDLVELPTPHCDPTVYFGDVRVTVEQSYKDGYISLFVKRDTKIRVGNYGDHPRSYSCRKNGSWNWDRIFSSIAEANAKKAAVSIRAKEKQDQIEENKSALGKEMLDDYRVRVKESGYDVSVRLVKNPEQVKRILEILDEE